jgi:hypothetical protein
MTNSPSKTRADRLVPKMSQISSPIKSLNPDLFSAPPVPLSPHHPKTHQSSDRAQTGENRLVSPRGNWGSLNSLTNLPNGTEYPRLPVKGISDDFLFVSTTVHRSVRNSEAGKGLITERRGALTVVQQKTSVRGRNGRRIDKDQARAFLWFLGAARLFQFRQDADQWVGSFSVR